METKMENKQAMEIFSSAPVPKAATVIGNVVGAGYYILYFLRGNSILSIHIRDFSVKDKIPGNVLSIGIPASLGSLLMSISQIIVNARMAGSWASFSQRGMLLTMR